MRAATAYFAGVGTVAVAIAAGLGGGLLLGDIMSPQQPKHPSSEVTRLEQRASPQPIQAANGASQPVPYLPSSQAAATVAEPASPPQQPAPQQASTPAPEPKQQPEPKANANSQPAAAPQTTAAAEQPAAQERTAPEDANVRDAYAKARDADVKRDARRAEESRRKAERRQQWAERRKPRQRDGDDLSEVEASVRQATESRPVFGRDESRARFGGDQGFGRVRIFESDD